MLYCVDCRVDEELENNFFTLNLWENLSFYMW